MSKPTLHKAIEDAKLNIEQRPEWLRAKHTCHFDCVRPDCVRQARENLHYAQTLLRDWQEFAKDSFVTIGDRELDKLGDLERRTQEVLEP